METPPQHARILVVDDEPSHLEYLEELLQVGGYRTEAALSGDQALLRARLDPPNLIVLDVGLPKMDGFEVCRRLKGDARTAAVPVIFVTGRHESRDKEAGLLAGAEGKDEAMRAGADDYVTKPVQAADLLSRVRVLLRVGSLRRDLDREIASLRAQRAHGGGAAP